jgi:hypothetical protein
MANVSPLRQRLPPTRREPPRRPQPAYFADAAALGGVAAGAAGEPAISRAAPTVGLS